MLVKIIVIILIDKTISPQKILHVNFTINIIISSLL